MKVMLRTKMSLVDVNRKMEEQNTKLHEHQIKPLLAALKGNKLALHKNIAAAGLRKIIPKDSQSYIILCLEEMATNKDGLEFISSRPDGEYREIILSYPDFFYDLLQKSQSRSIPQHIWDGLKRAGMMQKSAEQELKELMKDFKAVEGKWIEN